MKSVSLIHLTMDNCKNASLVASEKSFECLPRNYVLLCYAFCQGLGRQTPPEDDLLEVGSGKHNER